MLIFHPLFSSSSHTSCFLIDFNLLVSHLEKPITQKVYIHKARLNSPHGTRSLSLSLPPAYSTFLNVNWNKILFFLYVSPKHKYVTARPYLQFEFWSLGNNYWFQSKKMNILLIKVVYCPENLKLFLNSFPSSYNVYNVIKVHKLLPNKNFLPY